MKRSTTMSAKIVWGLTAVAGGAILLGQMKASGFPDPDKLSATDAILAGAGPEWPDGSLNGVSEAIDIGASRVGLNASGCGNDFHYYGTSGGIRAFSMASTACNWGFQVAEWIDTAGPNVNKHPQKPRYDLR